MKQRRVLQVGTIVWAWVGATMALSSLGQVNTDARVVVGVCSVLGPLCAFAASRLLAIGADRWAGGLLLLSVLTPTYFAYALNVPALVLGLVLVAAPRSLLPALTRSPLRRTASRRHRLAARSWSARAS